MQNYVQLSEIRNGVFGTVYKTRDVSDGNKIVATLKLEVPLDKNGMPASILREISILRQIGNQDHPNIIKLLNMVTSSCLLEEKSMTIFLVFEHIEHNLATYMADQQKPGMSSKIIKDVMRQLLAGVDFLHCNRIVHRDLKPENILVSTDLKIKIADFGLSKIYNFYMKLSPSVATLLYRSPEVLLGLSYSTVVDIWACGCIMGEMFKLTPLFNGESEIDQLDKIFKVIGLPSEINWPKGTAILRSSFKSHPQVSLKTAIPGICFEGEALLNAMLNFQCDSRVSAVEALKHPYFNIL